VRVVAPVIADLSVPVMLNTDQGYQFTSVDVLRPLLNLGVRLQMDS
jgi:hypothetical protein